VWTELSRSNRAACKNGNPSPLNVDDAPTCAKNLGSPDLVLQTTSKAPAVAPYNLWNYDPVNNFNQQDFDPEDEWYGWAIGYANYYNPTANYSGNGKAYNGASTDPFNPHDTTQDHPRHQCHKFPDLYSLYQNYLGPEYALFICNSNVGFLGDCFQPNNPCTYIGSSTERGYISREYQTVDEGYPVGSMTELCTRQKWLAQHNDKGVRADYVLGEKVLGIYKNYKKGKHDARYVVTTDKRKVYADEVIIATEPNAIAQMDGEIPERILEQPEFDTPSAVEVITITIHWKAHTPGWDWMDTITDTLWASYRFLFFLAFFFSAQSYPFFPRMINTGSCVNRLEILNTPYHKNGNMRQLRATYTDYTCLRSWLTTAKLDVPLLDTYDNLERLVFFSLK
jgi:hypothetical protein